MVAARLLRAEARTRRRLCAIIPVGLVGILTSGCAVSHSMQEVRGGEPEDFACAARSAGDGGDVSWFGPEREADRRTLAAWCSAVGPVEFIPEPARHQPAPAADSKLAVGTWNVHVGGGDLPGFLRDELGYECGAGSQTGFGEHFILLVQEAYRASATVPVPQEGAIVSDRIASRPPDAPRLDIVQVAEECGLALFYAPSTRNGKEAGEAGREDRGSAILSTLPLSNPVAVELPLEAQRRVTVAADVHGPEKSRLRVASVHFDVASNVLRVLSTGGSMRVRQNDGQTEALDSLDPQGTLPIIVGGDLNTWSSRETVIQRMLVTYPDSPDPGREKTRGNWPPDHLFFRAGTGPFDLVEGSYRVVVDDHGSDHRARLAEFVLR